MTVRNPPPHGNLAARQFGTKSFRQCNGASRSRPDSVPYRVLTLPCRRHDDDSEAGTHCDPATVTDGATVAAFRAETGPQAGP
eukprot:766628-Hanusia_phi.AAC.7